MGAHSLRSAEAFTTTARRELRVAMVGRDSADFCIMAAIFASWCGSNKELGKVTATPLRLPKLLYPSKQRDSGDHCTAYGPQNFP